MVRVVGSLTTLPTRYLKLLRTLKSLQNQEYQLDDIYLALPSQSRRLNQSYLEVPNEIKELCTIIPCDDYGPCTKILGALIRENDPDTIIITFDDDYIYPSNLITSILQYHSKYPNVAIGSSGFLIKYGFPFYSIITNNRNNWNNLSGFTIKKEGRAVDILCGFSAALYIRRFFPIEDELYTEFFKYPLLDKDVYLNDDIMISSFLSKQNIDRLVVTNIPMVECEKKYDRMVDKRYDISYDKITFLQRFSKAIKKVQEWGFLCSMQPVNLYETIGGRIIIIVLVVLVLLYLTLVLYTWWN